MKVALLVVCLLAIPIGAARGDILYLENGGRVEGVVSGGPEVLSVASIHGTAKIPAHRVTRRVSLPYITEVFAEKRKRIDADDPDELFGLALWCEREGLRREIEPLLRAVLLIDPDHARTRARQGLVRYAGTWMTPERALGFRMMKEGFVLYDGRWFTPDGLKAYIHAKQRAAFLEEIMARKREERQARERKIRDEERAREREEAQIAQAEEDRQERRRLQKKNDELVDALRLAYLQEAYDRSRRYSYVGWGWGRGYRPGWGTCWPPVATPYRSWYGSGAVRARGFGVGSAVRRTGTYTQSPIPIGRSRGR